jgi:hypothetical protein
MSGDYSRLGSRRWPIYDGTLLQQGRPLTDRDWNDLVAQLNRRDQAAVLDGSGPLMRSVAAPGAFKVTFDATALDLEIAPGRIYVDGLLAENFGTGDLAWDSVLAEEHGLEPVAYKHQKWMPNPPDLPASGGPYLVYLDVWRREVTHNQDGDIVEKAIGVDSTSRLQTVWQLKVFDATGVNCDTDLSTVTAFKPSSGRLNSDTEEVPGDDNPCLVPPSGGYKGLENQLYRVEIHNEGGLGEATFKWSRDNASVETRVSRLIDPTKLVVESVGRDDVLCFKAGDWVEITDDWKELNGLPGELRRIKVDGVDKTERTITLEAAVKVVPTPPGQTDPFPTDGDGNLQPDRNTRLRRWDQKGKVLNADGTVYLDLDLPGSDGAIVVPAGGGPLLLENGLVVTFSVAAGTGDGEFHVGDHWAIWARASDATIDMLDSEPPRGIHHHYAKLAMFTPPGTVVECKPAPEEEAADCCFTAVVAPGGDIQKAINDLPKEGGCICLKPGIHKIENGLVIPRSNVSLKGESAGVTIQLAGEGVVLLAGDPKGDRISGIDISTIAFERIESKSEPPAIVAFIAVDTGVIQDCTISTPSPGPSIGIYMEDGANVRVIRCVVLTGLLGIVAIGKDGSHDLLFEQNRIELGSQESDDPGGLIGIMVAPEEGISSSITRVVIRDNSISHGSFGVGVGEAMDVDIAGNLIVGRFKGLSIGIFMLTVWFGQLRDNSISVNNGASIACSGGVENLISANTMVNGGTGIFLQQETLPICTLNRIRNMAGPAIMMAAVLANATGRCDIAGNRIVACGFGGALNCAIAAFLIVGDLHIDGNEIINTGVAMDLKTQPPGNAPVYGIAAAFVQETTVEGNLVTYVNVARPPAAEDRALVMVGSPQFKFSDVPFGYPALITANKFTGWGRKALVELFAIPVSDSVVLQFERIIFSNNYCLHGVSEPANDAATVKLDGHAASALGNQVKCPERKYVSIDFKDSVAACVGNITSGKIVGTSLNPASVGLNLENFL